MSRYNHFSEMTYMKVPFKRLRVGDKFRMDRWTGKRRRKDVIMVKTSENSFREFKGKREYTLTSSLVYVSSYDQKVIKYGTGIEK